MAKVDTDNITVYIKYKRNWWEFFKKDQWIPIKLNYIGEFKSSIFNTKLSERIVHFIIGRAFIPINVTIWFGMDTQFKTHYFQNGDSIRINDSVYVFGHDDFEIINTALETETVLQTL